MCPLLMMHKTCPINYGHLADLQKALPTIDLNKKKLSFDKISPRDFYFCPFFSICTCLFYFVPYIPGKWTHEQPSNISLKFKITLLAGMHLTMNGRVCWHIETGNNWLPFYRRHLQIHFPKWKSSHFDYIYWHLFTKLWACIGCDDD